MSREVIAVLMPQKKRQHKSGEGVQALFRLEDGQVVLEDIADTGVFSGEDVARFRQAMAIKDPTHGGNPVAFSEKQYKSLAKKCVMGDL